MGWWPSRCRCACRHGPVWPKATHTGRKSGHPLSLVKALVTRVLPASQRKRARRPPEQALAASSRPPCCATRVFVTRSPLAGVHSFVLADSRGVFHAPLCIPVSPEPCWGNTPAGTTRFQRTLHGSFPFPEHGFSRGTLLVVGPPGPPVFPRTCPRATPCLSHLFPTEPSARVRSTWRLGPPGVRPGPLSLFPPRRPACLPALLPPVLSPLGLGAKTGTKIGAKNGATRRPPCRRGSRARPAAGSGRAAGAPPPCRGVASLPSARLNNAFWQIHRRGLGAPGPDQGCPLWLHAPRWTRGTWAIHPAALSRLWRGVASRDQPPEAPSFFDSVFRHWTRLEFLGVGHGSLPCAATAQQTNP